MSRIFREGHRTFYLAAILFAIAMFRASGAMDFLQKGLRTPLSWIGMPPEVLPMAIVRPLTGSGSLAVLASLPEPRRQHDGEWNATGCTLLGNCQHP